MDPQFIKDNIKRCLEVRLRAYAPYSKFYVGSLIIDENDNIYEGIL